MCFIISSDSEHFEDIVNWEDDAEPRPPLFFRQVLRTLSSYPTKTLILEFRDYDLVFSSTNRMITGENSKRNLD